MRLRFTIGQEYEASSDSDSGDNDLSGGTRQEIKGSAGTVYIHEQSVCPNAQGTHRPSECKRRVCLGLRQPVAISLFEASTDADRECALRCLRRVYWHDHKKGLVIYAGRTQWHDEGDRAACLGISGRLLQNANSGVDMEPARGDCSISSNARQSSHCECAEA